MKGLCHKCFTTNVDLVVTKGRVHCANCENIKDSPPKTTTTLEKLLFEDLPQGTEQERKNHIEQVMADLKEEWFARDMANERISEPLIDRIHDT